MTAKLLPPGFVAIDIAHALDLPLYDPDAKGAQVPAGAYPVRGNGLIGDDPTQPTVVVAANGGSDLVYLPTGDRALAAKIVAALSAQDYISGLFVDDSLGNARDAAAVAIALKGTAVTPMPAIAVNFRTFSLGCADPTTCGVEVADTALQQGQGMHGSFSRPTRATSWAPRDRVSGQHFEDRAPASNADIGKTIARLLALNIQAKGKLVGRD